MINMKNVIELKSVGCLLDMKNGVVYPQFKNGDPDLSCPLYLDDEELSSDWWEQLSMEDGLHITKAISFREKYNGNKGWIMSDDYLKVLENQKQ